MRTTYVTAAGPVVRGRNLVAVATAAAVCLLACTSMTHGARADDKSTANSGSGSNLVSTGHALFTTNCSPCHGADAQGDDGPNLHKLGLSDDAIASTVTTGIKDEMPPFASKLKGDSLKAVVAYVHSLQ
jgi:mono/diheme cytochrome c family protein